MAIITTNRLPGMARLAAVLAGYLACAGCSTQHDIASPAVPVGQDDTSIRHAILAAYQADYPNCVSVPDISVTQGLVVLGGNLGNTTSKVDSVREAWNVPGVQQVIDEIHTPATEDASYARDTALSMKLRGKLTFDPDINSTHYSIETVAGTVYIMGIAQNQAELDRVSKLAAGTGAKKVVNSVKLAS